MKTILMATILLAAGFASAQTSTSLKQPKLVIISDGERMDQESITTLFVRSNGTLQQMNKLRDAAQDKDIQAMVATLSTLSSGKDIYFEVRRTVTTKDIYVNVSVVRANSTSSFILAKDLNTLAVDEIPNSIDDLSALLYKAIKQQKENLSVEAQAEMRLKAAQKAAKDF